MSSLRLSLWIIFLALLHGPLIAQTTLLPFTLEDPQGIWRLTASERELNHGIRLVARVGPQNGPTRLLVFNYTTPLGVPRTLAEFADFIRSEIIILPINQLTSNPERHLEHDGLTQKFESLSEGANIQCSLFVYADDRDFWAFLEVTPPNSTTASAFPTLKKAKPAPAGAVALQPFRVHEDAITSFPISLRVVRNPRSDSVTHLVVTEVPPNSSTELAGVKEGDEILSLDDRAITTFKGAISRKSELGKLLIDRRPGATLEIEIISRGETQPRRVTLVAGVSWYSSHRD
jgi:hypothetical protein